MPIKIKKSSKYSGATIKARASALGVGGFILMLACSSDRYLEPVEINPEGTGFQLAKSHRPFEAWGFNYFRRPSTSDTTELILEEYWNDYNLILADLLEMKALGANTVRIHLQFGKFFPNSNLVPDSTQLGHLQQFVTMAEDVGLYLQITGLGCYYTSVNPAWYMALGEDDRLTAQETFWDTISSTLKGRNAVFAYDLINEPTIPNASETRTNWLTDESFGGSYYVQYLALSRNGRTPRQISKAFFDRMAAAIRQNDAKTLITAGIIPITKNQFYGSGTDESLDFADFHYYPTPGGIESEIAELNSLQATYGKPVSVGETSNLYVDGPQLKYFIDNTAASTNGYFAHYWGWRPEEYEGVPGFIPAIVKQLLYGWSSWAALFRAPAGNELKYFSAGKYM